MKKYIVSSGVGLYSNSEVFVDIVFVSFTPQLPLLYDFVSFSCGVLVKIE